MNYYLDVFRKYAEFEGRATRTQFWMFVLISTIISIALGAVDSFLFQAQFLAGLYGLAVIVPSIAVTARRLHDTGRSGWWQLISLVPVIGFIVLIVFLATKSDGANKYGSAPMGVAGNEVAATSPAQQPASQMPEAQNTRNEPM